MIATASENNPTSLLHKLSENSRRVLFLVVGLSLAGGSLCCNKRVLNRSFEFASCPFYRQQFQTPSFVGFSLVRFRFKKKQEQKRRGL
ncbi:hypothetical protein L6164_014532 [Bauhinia variegata]|uniref:Uncharacterized protein n=1 Tax=Bauhinia variegata TaxID=167791 RepID=A0ACB9NHF9_BAUVA|nr:hypothetical protein L6164_014532 [Bauhinia variegata]